MPNDEKNITQAQTEGYCTKYLTSTRQNGQIKKNKKKMINCPRFQDKKGTSQQK